MKKVISGQELEPFVHGALDTSFDDAGRMHFHRFTEPQLKRYDVDGLWRGTDFRKVASASSGIIIEMITDSDILGLNYLWTPATSQIWAGFDLYVDGCLYDHLFSDNQRHGILCFDLPEGEHKVALYLPWSVDLGITRIVLSDGASVKPVDPHPLRILAFGDSITQGYITVHPSLSYASIMTRKTDAECLNQAIGGYWFQKESLDQALASWKPDVITVAYGINDYSLKDDKEKYGRDAREYIDTLTGIFPGTPILGILPIHRPSPRGLAREKMINYSLDEAKNMLREAYGRYPQITVLEDTYYPRQADFYAPDLIHPNDLGFTFYGEAVVKKLKEMNIG